MAIFLYLYLRNLFLVYPVPNTKETCTISQVHLLDVRNYLLSTLIDSVILFLSQGLMCFQVAFELLTTPALPLKC